MVNQCLWFIRSSAIEVIFPSERSNLENIEDPSRSAIVEKLVYVRQKENGVRDLVNRVLPINSSDTISQQSEVYNNRDMEIKILVYGEIVFPFPNESQLNYRGKEMTVVKGKWDLVNRNLLI